MCVHASCGVSVHARRTEIATAVKSYRRVCEVSESRQTESKLNKLTNDCCTSAHANRGIGDTLPNIFFSFAFDRKTKKKNIYKNLSKCI